MPLLFSNLLSQNELDHISLVSYYHIIEEKKTGSNNIIRILPSDHGLSYPLAYKLGSKEIISGKLNFFNRILYENYSSGNYLPSEKFNIALLPPKSNNCIVLNFLDNCFGHSLLKLLHLKEFYEQFSGISDFFVIVPENLAHIIPSGLTSICTVKLSYRDMEKCYCLDNIIQAVKSHYKNIDFAVLDMFLPHSDREKLASFFPFLGPLEKKYPEGKYITYYYRKELWRSWGVTSQAKNIVKLFQLLRSYFSNEIKFCVVGELDSKHFPDWIIDKRVHKFSPSCDFEYNNIFKNSIIAIGVTGSNLLFPSILSGMTIHLVPSHKLGNIMEDTINYISPVVFGWHQNISLTGNATLSDYPPELLSEHIIMFYRSFLHKEYKRFSVNGLKDFGSFPGQAEYIAEKFKFYNYKKAEELKLEIQRKAGKKIRIHNYVAKIKGLFSIKR